MLSRREEPQFELPVGPDDESAAPPVAGVLWPAISPTAQAYAAARAALAAEMVGPLYGRLVEPELEHLAPPPVAMPPTGPQHPVSRGGAVPFDARPAVSVAEVGYSTTPAARPPVRGERRRHRRGLVIVAAAMLIGAVLLGAEALPVMLHPDSGPAVAAVDPTSTASPTETPESASALATATPTPSPTATPTRKPTAKPTPTRKPAVATQKPVVTPKPTPKPTPAMFAKWATDPPVPPNFKVLTRPGASCKVTAVNVANNHPLISVAFTANSSGLAALSWSLQKGRTYKVTATCTLGSKSASTPTRQITT